MLHEKQLNVAFNVAEVDPLFDSHRGRSCERTGFFPANSIKYVVWPLQRRRVVQVLRARPLGQLPKLQVRSCLDHVTFRNSERQIS